MSTADDVEIAVVGGGAIGLAVGWQLAERGREVTVLERGEVGAGASTAAAGMLAPAAEAEYGEPELVELGLESIRRYPAFVERLEDRSDADVDYREDGTLVVAVDRDDAAALDHIHNLHRELGLEAERLTGDEARELESGLAPSTQAGVYCRSDHQVDPRRLVSALAEALVRAGGQIRETTDVDTLLIEAGQVHGLVTADGDRIDTSRILVATGAWTRELDGVPDELRPHIRPVRGQMLAVDLGDPPLCGRPIRAPDPSRQDVYLVPKSDGRLLIGATSEERGFDPHLTAGGVFELLRGAYEAVPGIYDADLLEMWTGFRPVSLDNQPVLGPTDVDGLWYAVGHGRNGILLAPLTGETLAAAIDTGEIPEAIAGFTPASHSG